MKTIKQLSTELGISKEAIYKKLKFQLKNELVGHVFKVDGVTRVDGEGELLIRRSIHHERRAAIENVMGTAAGGAAGAEQTEGKNTEGQAHLTEYVNLLREQVKEKDIQIETQSGHIGQLIRQLGFHQLLIQNKRVSEPDIIDSDNAVESVKTVDTEGHRSFFGRIFKGRQKVTR